MILKPTNYIKPTLKRVLSVFVLLSCISFLSFTNYKDEDFFGVKTVVIDAGHGGHDGGCHGSYSNEKDIALAISLKLGEYIEEKFKDVKVIYTRKTDVFIPLYERAKIANKANADLFICVHVNSGPPTAIGTETYVMGLHKTEANLKVAKRENSSILLEEDYETTYSNFDPNSPESYIVLTLRQNAFIDQSLSFAAKIQQQFKERVGRVDRGVKQAGFLVLHQTNMPSVLIETGFLTNKEEEKFLNSEIGQDYIASAVYRAFKAYKNEIEDKLSSNENIEVINKDNTKDNTDKKPSKNNLIFKVQIATSSDKKSLSSDNFNGLKNVEVYEAGGLYRYTYGNEKTIEKANKLQLQVRANGFKDAFIVAFNNGKRISIGEAIKIQSNK